MSDECQLENREQSESRRLSARCVCLFGELSFAYVVLRSPLELIWMRNRWLREVTHVRVIERTLRGPTFVSEPTQLWSWIEISYLLEYSMKTLTLGW